VTRSGIVTLTSDFGTRDGYVGALKAAVLSRFGQARLVDLAHELEPGDIAAASRALAQAAPRFPPGTVHLAVVDPGVGSERRGLALALGEQLYVGPDNGLFSGVLDGASSVEAHQLANAALFAAPVSPTFHGRDVFGPVAGYLAAGGALVEVGPAVAGDLVRLAARVPTRQAGALEGVVVHVDRFGNLVTNLPESAAARGVSLEVAGQSLALSRSYADAAPGGLVAVVGSTGQIEIAVRGGSALSRLGRGVGLVVILRAPRESA
jgi:hypothetical protein